jgi:hypothetical protein
MMIHWLSRSRGRLMAPDAEDADPRRRGLGEDRARHLLVEAHGLVVPPAGAELGVDEVDGRDGGGDSAPAMGERGCARGLVGLEVEEDPLERIVR